MVVGTKAKTRDLIDQIRVDTLSLLQTLGRLCHCDTKPLVSMDNSRFFRGGPHSLAHDPYKSAVHGMQDPLTGSKLPDAYST